VPRIGIVDYGMGNRRSAEKAVEHVGASAFISFDHDALRAADGLLLPGVGAFPAAMAVIRERGLDGLVRERSAGGVPVFGACLGMQLLFEHSEEHGGADGLGLLGGTVRGLRAPGLKLPHIGWSAVRWLRAAAGGPGQPASADPGAPLSEGLPDPTFLYHVHSFVAVPADERTVLGVAEYGEPFAAVVGQDLVFGTQSHPEKSSTHGLRLLRNFAAVCAAAAADRHADPTARGVPVS
jgi:glutamine amidotransferase